MTLPSRLLTPLRIGAVSALAICALGTAVTTTANARTLSGNPVAQTVMSPNSGSGTASDPWVPEKQATIVCDSATVWGNYNGTSHSTPLGTVYRGQGVGVRYETSDHNSVMAYSPNAGTWGFILRSCVQFA